MSTFLYRVVAKIMEEDGERLNNICIVTPNRRASLFLRKNISLMAKKPIWSPDTLSMEDFVSRITKITIQEPIAVLLDFYNLYLELEQSDPEPLDEFIKWAPMLLKDFNEIDLATAAPEKIFALIQDAKTIENWNPDGTPPSDFQKRYLQFIKKTGLYHAEFSRYLLERGVSYHGLAYRCAAQLIMSEKAEIQWHKIYFTGFNALNNAEEIIIKSLEKQGIAQRLVDADLYYFENPDHEAGYFMRKYYKTYPKKQINFIEDNFRNGDKKIEFYGVAKNVNQAKLAGKLLSDLPPDYLTNNQTAVVLANEELLLPMLNSIPPKIDSFNVTMGYPLRKTNLYGFVDFFFQLHLSSLRLKTHEGNQATFYHKDIIKILRHPLTSLLLPENGQAIFLLLINKISETNRPFLTWQNLYEMGGCEQEFETYFGVLFKNLSDSPLSTIATLRHLVDQISMALKSQALKTADCPAYGSECQIDLQAIEPLSAILRKISMVVENHHPINDIRLLFMLFQSMARDTRVVLSGEPLTGLQIMGMLETQNLDFKNVIIISANESILPAAKSSVSLIPFDIKASFGIPVYRDRDSIFAYHFYRLLQRAEKIQIIYNTQSNDPGCGEKSRFITQLQLELPFYNPNISITKSIVTFPLTGFKPKSELTINKSEDIILKLEELNQKGLSPSSLLQYIKCPLLFYFRKIIGLQEDKTTEKTVESKTLGVVLHDTLARLYDSAVSSGCQLIPSHLEKMEEMAGKQLRDCFTSRNFTGELTSGKNLLLYNVASIYIRNFLNWEKGYLKSLPADKNVIYLSSEKILKASIMINKESQKKKINLMGFADRIDMQGNAIRIIDYKTGMVDSKKELKIKYWEDLFEDINLGKSFQLLMYSFLFSQTDIDANIIVPGIFSLRQYNEGLLTVSLPDDKDYITNETLKPFTENLQILLEEIFDPKIPFQRTELAKNCLNCDYTKVCNSQ